MLAVSPANRDPVRHCAPVRKHNRTASDFETVHQMVQLPGIEGKLTCGAIRYPYTARRRYWLDGQCPMRIITRSVPTPYVRSNYDPVASDNYVPAMRVDPCSRIILTAANNKIAAPIDEVKIAATSINANRRNSFRFF
jgi:hypothetical protein